MENILLPKSQNRGKIFNELLPNTPLIAAVLNRQDLEKCLEKKAAIVNLLFGDIRNIVSIVEKCKAAGKFTFVHLDFIEGLSSRDVAVDFIAENTCADGIVSTKSNLIKRAKALGLVTIQRFFVMDSISLANLEKQLPLGSVDALEIMPGIMPKVIRRIAKMTSKPIIAGGLISDTEDVRHALEAGAISTSASRIELLEEFYHVQVHTVPGSGDHQLPGHTL
jgi:glycerol-3-phosphate responsive antiterminator